MVVLTKYCEIENSRVSWNLIAKRNELKTTDFGRDMYWDWKVYSVDRELACCQKLGETQQAIKGCVDRDDYGTET